MKGFQKVFVEDLGQELLMDPNGNLYDLQGNIIGQAAGEDDEQDSAGPVEERQHARVEEVEDDRPLPPRRSHSP